jgi:hypothetical protein
VSDRSCPGCGESDALHGRPRGDDIEVTCGSCGSIWMRGAARCRGCGRADGVTLPQRMTRHPRGTLLAVVGVRDTLLCPVCDRDVVDAALSRKDPVPEGYVSRFLRGASPEGAAAPGPAPGTSAAPPRKDRRGPTSVRVGVPEQSRGGTPERMVDPTVRQATEAFLDATDDEVDSVVLVLLGTLLGASTRVSALGTARTADRVVEWLDRTWGSAPSERRTSAAGTLRSMFGHWREQGWLDSDVLLDALA